MSCGCAPKTRSGKVLRATMAKIADGKSWMMSAWRDCNGVEVNRVCSRAEDL